MEVKRGKKDKAIREMVQKGQCSNNRSSKEETRRNVGGSHHVLEMKGLSSQMESVGHCPARWIQVIPSKAHCHDTLEDRGQKEPRTAAEKGGESILQGTQNQNTFRACQEQHWD